MVTCVLHHTIVETINEMALPWSLQQINLAFKFITFQKCSSFYVGKVIFQRVNKQINETTTTNNQIGRKSTKSLIISGGAETRGRLEKTLNFTFIITLVPDAGRNWGQKGTRGWDGWMAWPTRWTWVWVNSGSWWWTGRPAILWFMGSQRVRHNWAPKLNWITLVLFKMCYNKHILPL